MKTNLEHKFPVCTTIYAPFHMTISELLLHMCKVCSVGKKHVYRRCCTRILTDTARKSNRKEFLANYNKTRINIVHLHDLWMELKEELRVQIHAEVPLRINF